jgi:hypothetical protein
VLGHADTIHVGCAWAYACLRIAHSGVQAAADIVMTRFGFFAASWLVLTAMIVRESIALFRSVTASILS